MDGAEGVSVATASPITSLLDNFLRTGLLLGELSRMGLDPVLKGGVQLRRATYFLGCCGQEVAPLETLVGHFLHLRMFQLYGISSVCVIAQRLTRNLSALCQATAGLRACEHLAIAQRIMSVTRAQTEVIVDEELGDTGSTRTVSSWPRRDSSASQERIHYYLGQHGILQAVRSQFDVQLKTGWSMLPNAAKLSALVQSCLTGELPSSTCEAGFDALTIATDRAQKEGSPMCFMYTSPTRTFCAKYPVAVPYSARRICGRGIGRIHLRKGQSLSRVIPDPAKCRTASCKDRAIAAMTQLGNLMDLIEDALPGFFVEARDEALREMELEILSCQSTWHHMVEVHGLRSREARVQATTLRQLRVEHASALRAHLIPKVRRVVDVFGI